MIQELILHFVFGLFVSFVQCLVGDVFLVMFLTCNTEHSKTKDFSTIIDKIVDMSIDLLIINK